MIEISFFKHLKKKKRIDIYMVKSWLEEEKTKEINFYIADLNFLNCLNFAKSSFIIIINVEFMIIDQELLRKTHFDLFTRGHSTENYLSEALGGKHSEANPSNHMVVFYQSKTLVFPGKNREYFVTFSWKYWFKISRIC